MRRGDKRGAGHEGACEDAENRLRTTPARELRSSHDNAIHGVRTPLFAAPARTCDTMIMRNCTRANDALSGRERGIAARA